MLSPPLANSIASIIGGTQTDVKAALDDAANQANKILAENKAKYGDTPKAP